MTVEAPTKYMKLMALRPWPLQEPAFSRLPQFLKGTGESICTQQKPQQKLSSAVWSNNLEVVKWCPPAVLPPGQLAGLDLAGRNWTETKAVKTNINLTLEVVFSFKTYWRRWKNTFQQLESHTLSKSRNKQLELHFSPSASQWDDVQSTIWSNLL